MRVISLSKGEVVNTLGGHTEGESIEAVVFIDITGTSFAGPGVAVTGATDGKACIWDLSTMRLRATLEHKVRFCFLSFSVISSIVFAGRDHDVVGSPSTKTLPTNFSLGR